MGRRAAPIPAADERGSVMFLAIVLILVLAGLASAFMETTVWRSRGNVASGQRTRAFYVAEAGASIAVADVMRGGAGNLGAAETPVAFGGGGYWTSTVDHGDGTFTVTAIGAVSGQRRGVQITVAPDSNALFTKAVFGHLDLDVGGSVLTDSYESDLGSYASQAVNVHPVTGATYAVSMGSIGSNGNISINGSVTVLGDATPGPEHSVSLSGGAYVDGATTPAAEPMPLPPVTYSPPIGSAGALSTNTDRTFTAGTYRFDDFDIKSKAVITIEGDVTLYVDGDFNVAGQSQILIENGASLTIRHGGSDFSLTGGGVLNLTQRPENLQIYSTAASVKFAGNAGFYGVVYAPDASLHPTGTSDLFGSFVGKEITITGNVNIHFDEMLASAVGFTSTPQVVSWRLVPAGD